MVCRSSSLRRSKKSSCKTDLLCVFFNYYLQEEFTTLEEKASNVLQDYEKAQVSCNVKLEAPLFFFPFMLESVEIFKLCLSVEEHR